MDKRMVNVWDRYAKFLYRNDPRTIDWANNEQPKFFPYVDFKSQKIKVGKTTNLILPTMTYASHPRLVRKAVEYVGELALKKYGFVVEMTKKNSGLPIKVNLYEISIEGAGDGLRSLLGIIPSIFASTGSSTVMMLTSLVFNLARIE